MLALRYSLKVSAKRTVFAAVSPYQKQYTTPSAAELEAKKSGDYRNVDQVMDWENFSIPGAPYMGKGPLPPVSDQVPVEAQLRLGIIPESFFKVMEAKLGYTGGYTLLWGSLAALTSKEWVIMSPEVCWTMWLWPLGGAFLHMGLFPFLEREDMIKVMAKNDRVSKWKDYKMGIAESEVDGIARLKEQASGLDLIQEQRKNNLAMALEAEFVNRQADLTEQVKKRLDYHVSVRNAEREAHSKHMISWIEAEVKAAIEKRSPKEDLNAAIAQLKSMAK